MDIDHLNLNPKENHGVVEKTLNSLRKKLKFLLKLIYLKNLRNLLDRYKNSIVKLEDGWHAIINIISMDQDHIFMIMKEQNIVVKKTLFHLKNLILLQILNLLNLNHNLLILCKNNLIVKLEDIWHAIVNGISMEEDHLTQTLKIDNGVVEKTLVLQMNLNRYQLHAFQARRPIRMLIVQNVL